MRERVGAELEVDHERARQGRLGFAGGARSGRVDAFDVEGGAVARGHPQAAALPADIRVVDAAFEALLEGPHRVGHAQFDNLAADQRAQGIGLIAGGDRHIGAEPQNVVLVDPGVIGVLPRRPGHPESPGRGSDRRQSPPGNYPPSLRPGRWRPLTLAAVEAGDMTSVERHLRPARHLRIP
jgi:hypothetical protein